MINLKNKKVAVLGLLHPGQATIEFACNQGAKVKAYGFATEEDKQHLLDALKGNPFELITDEIPVDGLDDAEIILLTPGGARRYAKQLEREKAKAKQILTDLELACSYYKAPLIAVTGTNGKSSVVKILQTIFETAQKKVVVAGGDYEDFSRSIQNSKNADYIILEVNSSRLERTSHFHPHISVFLNLYTGHSERHATFKEYAEAKAKIFAEQTEADYIVFSTETVYKLIKEKACKAQRYPFSVGRRLSKGAYLDSSSKQIVFSDDQNPDLFSAFSYSNLGLVGNHNLENCMAAVDVAKLCGISDAAIQKALDSLKALPDRMEPLQKIEGVRYFNDAKSVNPIATYSVLHGFENGSVVLIAGGRFTPHAENKYFLEMLAKKVRCLILFGTDRRQFHKIWGDKAESYVVPTLKDAVELAFQKGEKGNAVVFSPACPPELHVHGSTQKRGDSFRRLVKERGEIGNLRKGNPGKI